MRRFIRRRPSPAMVVAGLALLLVLGGTSIAAVTAVPNNSVGSAQLKNNAVTAAKIASNAVTSGKIAANAVTGAKITANAVANAKIANGAVTEAKLASHAVTNSKIADHAVTGAKVEDHSLLEADFAPGQIPKGPPGPPGTVGKLTLRSASGTISSKNSTELTASCNSAEQAVSGGATWSDKGDLALTLVYSNPVYNASAGRATGWVARGRNQTDKSREFIVQVLCGATK